jgi:hypothetical protein
MEQQWLHFLGIPKPMVASLVKFTQITWLFGEDIADLKSKLNACSTETAKEVKFIVISFQQLPKGLPQF